MSRVLVDTNVYISALAETLATKFGWSEARVNEACGRLWRHAYRVEPDPLPGVVRDADDDHVIAAAIESGAMALVTGDRDLLLLGEFRGIRIVTPVEFIALFTAGAR